MKHSRLAFCDGVSPVTDTHLRTLPESLLLIRYGKTAFTKGGVRGEFEFTEADASKSQTQNPILKLFERSDI